MPLMIAPPRRLSAGRLLALALAALLAAGLAQAAWTTVKRVRGARHVQVLVNEKPRAYWKLERGDTLSTSVNGPSVLRVVTRSPWRVKHKGQAAELQWLLDGRPGGVYRHAIIRSRAARLEPPKSSKRYGEPARWPRLSASHTEEIQIPYGTHKVQLVMGAGPCDYELLRFKLKGLHPLPKGGLVDLLPRQPGATRIVAVKEARNSYQVLASGDELSLDVSGPTVVKVISRLDWNDTMAGQQKYQLKVFEDGALKNTWVLRGRHSNLATYQDKDDSTPARAEALYIEVPAGRHEYQVRFQDSGRQVNLRFLMPRAALRNGGK